jgi:hypothetical protein
LTPKKNLKSFSPVVKWSSVIVNLFACLAWLSSIGEGKYAAWFCVTNLINTIAAFLWAKNFLYDYAFWAILSIMSFLQAAAYFKDGGMTMLGLTCCFALSFALIAYIARKILVEGLLDDEE